MCCEISGLTLWHQALRHRVLAGEFLQHATEEQQHADQLAQRIVQLGGEPDLSPQELHTRSHSEYVEGDFLVEMIKKV